MLMSKTARKLPFTCGIKEYKHFSKHLQRLVNLFKHMCFGKHNKYKPETQLPGVSASKEPVLLHDLH